MADRIEPVWPLCGDAAVVADGTRAGLPGLVGSHDAAIRCVRRALATARRPADQRQRLAVAGRRGRIFMGSVCRADPGPGFGRRGIERGESLQRAAAAGVRRRRGNFVGGRVARRRTGVQHDETRIGCRGMVAPRSRGRGAGRSGGYRTGLGYALSFAVYVFEHCKHRAKIDRAAGHANRKSTTRRRHCRKIPDDAASGRGYPLVQLPGADQRDAARQGGAGRFLDILVH